MERTGSEKSKRAYYIASTAVCLCVFAAIYALNRMTPLHDDDYHFCFVFYDLLPVEYDRRVAGIADILLSVRNYYLLSGGRAVSHFLVYLMLFIGKGLFNVVNSLMFVALGLLITFCVRPAQSRRRLSNALLLAAVYGALWLFLPMVGETVFWLSGAVNYLWMACIDLAFLLCYINYARSPSPHRRPVLRAALMLPFGVLAGATNENSGGAVLLILFVYFLICKKIRLKSPCGHTQALPVFWRELPFWCLRRATSTEASALSREGRLWGCQMPE